MAQSVLDSKLRTFEEFFSPESLASIFEKRVRGESGCGRDHLSPVFRSSPSQFITVIYSVEYKDAGKDAGKDAKTLIKPDIYVLKLLNVVGGKTLTVKDMMGRLNLKGSDNFRKKYLNPAIKGGYIALLYPEKPRKKGQAYYLTDLGKALVERTQ